MKWNWQRSDWPNFRWDTTRLARAEQEFLVGGGMLAGTLKHLGSEEQEQLAIEAMSTEAVTTSKIEGEVLDRASVKFSIRKQLGLTTGESHSPPAEQGIAEMMVDLYHSWPAPLSDQIMFAWHRMLMAGRRDLMDIGRYRRSLQPMQVVSGAIGRPKLHFEAPPSSRVPSEMARFVQWFNEAAPENRHALPGLARAGVAHLYFECIHPFEDGNGRIGRAVAEKSLSQNLAQPALTALAATILAHQSSYYKALEAANKENEITGWLTWFAGTVIEAQRRTLAMVEFVIDKTKLLERLKGHLNKRQEKALLRMFREGPEGFKGEMSASKYEAITGASPATTTRDLADLVEKNALVQTGERRHTRYQLNMPMRVVRRVSINERGELTESV